MKCTICNEEVILIPSAAARTKNTGETAEYYTRLFPQHTACTLKKRADDVRALINRKNT